MFRNFYPWEYSKSVFDIDYKKLYRQGYRGIIFDVDNTLVHHGDDSTPEVDQLFRTLHEIGFKTFLLTDNNEERVKRFIRNIDTQYLCEAGKPDPSCYRKALEALNMDRSQVVCIGDQIFLDILGANRAGIASILVHFIWLPSETKIGKRRQLEKVILWFYRHNRSAQHRLGNIHKEKV